MQASAGAQIPRMWEAGAGGNRSSRKAHKYVAGGMVKSADEAGGGRGGKH